MRGFDFQHELIKEVDNKEVDNKMVAEAEEAVLSTGGKKANIILALNT